MNNTCIGGDERDKGQDGGRKRVKGIEVERVKDRSGAGRRERRRALIQHSAPDCRLSTSPNCQGQTLSVLALRWANNRDAVAQLSES